MRKKIAHYFLSILLALFCCATSVSAQNIKGRILDAENNQPLIGASVLVKGTTIGATTDIDGQYMLNAKPGQTLIIKIIGYNGQQIVANAKMEDILLKPNNEILKDVIITSQVAIARKTPVAASTITANFIEERLGNQDFPEILKSTPGIWVTRDGGGFGDSKLNMRGFGPPNVAVMVNGVPVNDMEWGGIYWSNWAGLSDVTRSMQTQRGMGASKISSPSVGGSINIITRSLDQQKGGSISYEIGNDGMNKYNFMVSSGMNKNGWAFTVLGGKTWGDGYIQGTGFVGYNYFINISKKLTENQQLSFTAFGAPQKHYQRSSYDGLSIQGWQSVKNYMKDGNSVYKYNPTYGYDKQGKPYNATYNVYHKPQISLNHLWQIDEKASLSTVLYASIGRGYGNSGRGTSTNYANEWYGTTNGSLNTYFRNADGSFAYDQIYDMNAASANGSNMAMTKSQNFHNWIGLLSTYTTKIGKDWDVYGGIDARYYVGIHTNKITDLFGGKYFTDNVSRANVLAANNSAATGNDYVYQKLGIGDIVYRDYSGHVLQEGVFGQGEYNHGNINAFVSGSISNTGYWRYDRFYYDKEHAKSKTLNFMGFTAKGGVNYNIDKFNNVFANVGYISRAPFFSGGAFLNSTVSNVTNKDAINEKVFSLELGYGFKSRFFTANVNAYSTSWMNKTMTKNVDNFTYYDHVDGTVTNGDHATLNMQGVNALHQGIEVDLVAKPFYWLDINGMLSLGNWRWNSNAKGYFYTSNGQALYTTKNAAGKTVYVTTATGSAAQTQSTINLKGVKVGGSAQTTAALGAKIKLDKDLSFGLNYNAFSRQYADFAISATGADQTISYGTPWRIPGSGTFDLDAQYRFKMGGVNATLSTNINNLFNQENIVDAYDGSDHNWQSAYRVFYGFGRTFDVRLKIKF